MQNFDRERQEDDIRQEFLAALRELPDASAQLVYSSTNQPFDRGIDAEVELIFGGKSFLLIVEIKKHVYPRDAERVLWQLHKYSTSTEEVRKGSPIPVLAAESISPGARDILKAEGCGFFDTGGSLFIPARGAYIYIEKPPPKTHQKAVISLFSGKRAQVVHALLLHSDEWFGVNHLSDVAHVSPATASETLSALEKFEWLETRGKGPTKERKLASPGAVLDEWKKRSIASARKVKYKKYYVPRRRPEEIVNQISEFFDSSRENYALTQECAGQMYAPFLSDISRISCRVSSGRRSNELPDYLDARPVEEGANLQILETLSEGDFLFREKVNGIWLASPVQVYIDLLQSGGRGKEMAEYLRHERIGY